MSAPRVAGGVIGSVLGTLALAFVAVIGLMLWDEYGRPRIRFGVSQRRRQVNVARADDEAVG